MTAPTPTTAPTPPRKPMTLTRLLEMKRAREPIAMLTCYDASFAALLHASGVDVQLVGDSLGMVVQGHGSTLPVTNADIAYHVGCVARGAPDAWVIADLPFGSYHADVSQALAHAVVHMQAGARMVKVEGGAWLAPTVQAFERAGIPVCGHLGFTPQSVHALGGYRVQGRSADDAQRMLLDARALEDAGASMLVLEMTPAALAAEITQALSIPVIGIGAGVDCDGQVLVLHDALGVYPGRKLKFVRDFSVGSTSVGDAVARYVAAVKSRAFPAAEHTF